MQKTLTPEDDNKSLEELNIVQGTIIHLQDSKLANQAKVSKSEIDWSKMTGSPEAGQIDSSQSNAQAHALLAQNNMAQIDLMLYRFIEHRQLFEFIEVHKVYLKDKKK